VRFFNFFAPSWDEPLGYQLNPDVPVRPGGVMEKCTFCVQRIQKAAGAAKDAGRALRDGDVQPACAAACPAEAIVFGDRSDDESRVSVLGRSRRAIRLLEDLGTKPRVTYLKSESWEEESIAPGPAVK